MDAATALSVAQTLLATLQCAEVRNLCSIFKYEFELKKLVETVNTIKCVLLDADSKCQELTYGGQNWVKNLKDAVYDADDLLDEFNTVAHQLKNMPGGGKIMKKVRRFFSSNNQLMFAVNMSKEIKNLREKLDSLAKNHKDFGFSELYKPVKSREETCSYVYEQSIIGRDVDKEAIVDLLLQEDDSEINISFVTIVGIGGMGKTTLAQIVFSDHRIKEAFKDEMYWVCVSLDFDTKDILAKMLGMNELVFEYLHKKIRDKIEGKRFLLVLDDVWYENCRKWDELKNFLILGGGGSRILVTSRSKKVAGAIGNYPIYELPGLLVEDSWALFKNVSLGQREDEAVNGLVEIGRDIVIKCANVPLSIRVVGSLLRDQDIATWQSLRSINLANMCGGEDGVMPTLMFSYYHLATELKSCFSFCSLFPEDFVISKTKLIHLWMAQGYLVPSAKTESMEDVGEKYISIFLQRCFFQDIERGEFGEVESFKMHDLVHELARNVAAKECSTFPGCSNVSEGKFRHLYLESNGDLTTWFRSINCPTKTLRTCLKYSASTTSDVDAIISNCGRLRVLSLWASLTIGNLPETLGKLLHLRYLEIKNDKLEMFPKSISKLHNLQTLRLSYCSKLKELPDDTSKLVNLRVLDMLGCKSLTHLPAGMGELLQLRYLDLSRNSSLEMLPKSFTNLRNLQTLKLCRCYYLKELPEDTSKLVNLRVLNIYRCDSLTHMPEGMGKLTCLSTLTTFVVGEIHDQKGRLEDLTALINNNLSGDLDVVHYYGNSRNNMFVKLKSSKLRCKLTSNNIEDHEALVESMFCNQQFQELEMSGYGGTKLPSLVSRLVLIKLSYCTELQHLPSSLSQLCHLKSLVLESMENLEYIDIDAPSPSAKFFPALEELKLLWMPAFRGWWRDEAVFIPSFPQLRKLYIYACERLTYVPPCPLATKLELRSVNEALTFCMKDGGVQSNPLFLERLVIDNPCVFNSLFREFVGSAVSINLNDIENMGTIRDGLTNCSSVKDLEIWDCRGLENLEIEHLNSLESLTLRGNMEGMPWKSLHSLSSLKISRCDEVTVLPKGIQYLTSLQSLFLGCQNLEDLGECFNSLISLKQLRFDQCSKLKSLPEEMRYVTCLTTLEIDRCRKLKSLPEAMRHLTSLTSLKISDSNYKLHSRCWESGGEDWPKICHIPNIYIDW